MGHGQELLPGARASIAATWARIDAVLGREAPLARENLQEPASEQSLHELETALGFPLPRQLADSLRVHDGQRGSYMSSPFVDNQWLLSTRAIQEQWAMRNGVNADLGAGRDTAWWAPHFVPFTDSEGDALCVDRRGVGAAVVAHVHDQGMLEPILAPSLGEWLERLADALERGRFEVRDEGVWLEEEEGLALIYGP